MKTNLNFKSAICTSREQSERLLALGLRRETADMCWTIRADDREGNEYSVEYMSIGQGEYQMMHPNWYIPAWSLHRLIEMIPIAIPDASGITHYFTTNEASNVSYYYFGEECWEIWKSWNKKALYDNIIDCIEWLISIKQFNKEYLEEEL